MEIIILIKQVPDTSEVKLDPKTGNLIREGVESIINPDDRHAIEAAVRIKESVGARLTALSMGPPQAMDAVSEALGLGADKGILLCDRAFAGADTWATSATLGRAIQHLEQADLVICGRQAIDGDTAQIGPQVAEFLGIPNISYVCDIEQVREGSMIVKRRLEDGFERLECPLPALITVIEELNQPRYGHMAALIAACGEKAPIREWNAADIGAQTADVGLEGSLTHVIKTFAPKFQREGERFEGDPAETVPALIGKLKENRLVP